MRPGVAALGLRFSPALGGLLADRPLQRARTSVYVAMPRRCSPARTPALWLRERHPSPSPSGWRPAPSQRRIAAETRSVARKARALGFVSAHSTVLYNHGYTESDAAAG